MKKRIGMLIMLIMIITSSVSYGQVELDYNLRSYLLADFETGEILEEYNSDEVIEIASISKLMTYLVIMDEVEKGNLSLDERIVVDEDVARVGGSTLRLETGEIFQVKELLEASLVVSANDATYALAKHVGVREEFFADMMNEKAREIGLTRANFYNSTGLPLVGKDVQNSMTTKELLKLSKYIIEKYPEILEISKIPIIEVKSRDYLGKNTNPLLKEFKEVDGLKTGFTNKAGYCYVSTFNIAAEDTSKDDLRLISIVMGARNARERNEMSKKLAEYGMENYSKKIFFDEDNPVGTIEIPKGNISQVKAFARDDFSKLVKNDEDIRVKFHLDENLKLPIKKEKKIGRALVENDNDVIFETDLILKEDVKKINIFTSFGRYISSLYNKLIASI